MEENFVQALVLTEFDLKKGSTVRFQYPKPLENANPELLASYMMPDGTHNKKADIIYFVLNRGSFKGMQMPTKKPIPAENINLNNAPGLDTLKDKFFPINLYLFFEQTNEWHMWGSGTENGPKELKRPSLNLTLRKSKFGNWELAVLDSGKSTELFLMYFEPIKKE